MRSHPDQSIDEPDEPARIAGRYSVVLTECEAEAHDGSDRREERRTMLDETAKA